MTYKYFTATHLRKTISAFAFVVAFATFSFWGTVVELVGAQIVDIPVNDRLEVHKDDVLGARIFDVIERDADGVPIPGASGVRVSYAYRSDVVVGTNPTSAVLHAAQQLGVQLGQEDISKRTNKSRFFPTSDPGVYAVEFISGRPQYHKDNSGSWWQIEYGETSPDAFNRQMGLRKANIAFASSEFFPDPDTETSTVDGQVEEIDANWDTAHDATLSNDAAQDSNSVLTPGVQLTAGGNYLIRRAVISFNTGVGIGSAASINSAALHLTASAKADDENDAQSYLTVVQTQGNNLVSDTAVNLDDYEQVGDAINNPTEGIATGDRADITNVSTSAVTVFPLNATGIGWIARSGEAKPAGGTAGITYLGMREGHDVEDSAPGTVGFSNVSWKSAETSGTNDDPKLVVIFTETFEGSSVRKSVDEQVSNSTTLQDDDTLALGLASNTSYIITGAIFASSTSADPDIKIAFDVPVGSTMDIGYIAVSDVGIQGIGDVLESDGTASDEISITANNPLPIQMMGTIKTSSTAGDVTLQWAQSTSDATATTIKEGSYLRIEQL